MMRQSILQCLRSTKLISTKPNPSLSNTNIEYGFIRTKMSWSLTHAQHFCKSTVFTVTRSEPELVGPAEPTPRELKPLSFIDNRLPHRLLTPIVQLYRYDDSKRGMDPARVIRDALARALVFYYPLAGRLREGPDGRLLVECTGEGVWFVEAEADVELAHLGDPPRPPFPWIDEFMLNVPTFGSGRIINSPLVYIQVTRLKCGSFVVGLRINHIMSDAGGFSQFLTAVGQIARGAHTPSVTPVWKRKLFKPPEHSTCTSLPPCKRPDNPAPTTVTPSNNLDLTQHSFFIGPSQLLALRNLTPDHSCVHATTTTTTFEILTAFLWRCRVASLDLPREDTTRLLFAVSARDKTNRVIPSGYYGNTLVPATSEASAGELCERPMGYAIGLMKRAKEEATREYLSWRTDSPMIGGHPSTYYRWGRCLFVTDTRRVGFVDVDYGWGKAAYAGLAKLEMEGVSSYVSSRNCDGEDGVLVSICLQAQNMESFKTKVNDNMLINMY